MTSNKKPLGAGTLNGFKLKLSFNQPTNYITDYKSETNSETRQKVRVIKLFRCFGCDRCFSTRLMSSFLVICKSCLISERIESERSPQRFVEKTLSKIGGFLRRCV